MNNRVLFLVVLLYLDKALGQSCKPRDCIDLKCYRVSTAKRGVYIYPNSTTLPKVLITCQQTGDGGGWIVYMRRFDGSEIFNRTWNDYKNGFGQQGRNKESWLGNEKVHQLEKTFDGGAKIRIEGHLFNGSSSVISADNFRLDDESTNYTLRFGSITSATTAIASDWDYHKNRPFSTYDTINTYCVGYSGGWWFKRCHHMYLTGWYPSDPHEISGLYHTMYFTHYANIPFTEVNILFRSMVTTRPDCNNPCQNNGGCEYVESTDNYHCACPKTHCGLHCEKDNPCKNNGTCVYSPKTKDTSCVCVVSYTGNLCETRVTAAAATTAAAAATTAAATNATAITKPAESTTNNVPVIIGVIIGLMLLIIISTIAAGVYIVSKKKKEEEEEERRKQEEREKEAEEYEEEEAADEETMLGYISSLLG